jgi:predicted dehydrogenase
MSKENPNIAVLGLNQGMKFVESLSLRSGYVGGNLIAVCSIDPPPKNLPDVEFYTDYIKMFDELEGQLDGIVAALPNNLHVAIVEEAAKRGVAVLLEKPIAGTVEEARKIIDTVNKTKIPFLVGHHRRFSAKMQAAKEVIDSGRIGRILGANIMWVCKKQDEYFNKKWRITKGVGGPLLINVIHNVDDLRFTVGEIEAVQAILSNNIRGNEVEDIGTVNFKFKNGAIASYIFADGVPCKFYYEGTCKEDSRFYPVDANCYYFFGDKGTLSFPTMEITGYNEKSGGADWTRPFSTEFVPVDRFNPIDGETKHFCDLIKGVANKSLCTAEDATINVQVLEAIRESAETGKTVYLEQLYKVEDTTSVLEAIREFIATGKTLFQEP